MNGSAARRGQKLLYVTFPTVLQKGRVKVINGLPTAAKGEPIINVSDISKLVEIPPLETITEARDVLLKANEGTNPRRPSLQQNTGALGCPGLQLRLLQRQRVVDSPEDFRCEKLRPRPPNSAPLAER